MRSDIRSGNTGLFKCSGLGGAAAICMTTTILFRLSPVLAIVTLIASGCTSTSSSVSALEEPLLSAPDIAPVPALKPDAVAAFAPAEEQPGKSLVAEAEAAAEPDVAMAMTATEASAQEIEVSSASDDLESPPSGVVAFVASKLPGAKSVNAFSAGSGARTCLMRAMYFESNRSSRDGQLAVGTVVMNRVASGRYGRSVCGVVGARGQFAPGVMSRRMQGDTRDLAKLADSILRGKRHPRLYPAVMHFHQQGLRFRYGNMKYVVNAGGNSFYEKTSRRKKRR
jgi:Cell Wall Hydrolase